MSAPPEQRGWTRIFIHAERLANPDALDHMEEFLLLRDDPDQFSVIMAEDDRGKFIGLIFRIAQREIAIDFRDQFA